MTLKEALGQPSGRYDRVGAAYDGMAPADREIFREAIQNPAYTPAHIAQALRAVGYDVDRKQVQHFREKVSLGKVDL